jgi:AcrR family transcriptional regulator
MTRIDSQEPVDPRVQQTRAALFQAFASLVLNRTYDAITVADIIQTAGVSRSTFYQHYRNKDDILAESMGGLLSVLAEAACGRGNLEKLEFVLNHLWENRQMARIILSGPPYREVTRSLTDLIEQRLGSAETEPVQNRASLHLEATQLAEGQFGTIRAWLRGDVRCRTSELAVKFTTH